MMSIKTCLIDMIKYTLGGRFKFLAPQVLIFNQAELFLLLGHHFSVRKIDKLQNSSINERGPCFYELCNIQKSPEGE